METATGEVCLLQGVPSEGLNYPAQDLLTDFERRMESTHIPMIIFLVGIVLLATASSRVFSKRQEPHAPSEWTLAHNHISKRIGESKGNHDQKSSMRLNSDSDSVPIQILVSLLVLAAGLYIILSEHYVEEKKWGYGMVGSVMGYWLRR